LVITVITIARFATADIASAQTSFTGTWKRNNDKTDAGDISINSVAAKLEISQDKTTFTVEGTNINGAGEISTFIDVIKLDGSIAERITSTGQKKSIVLQWSADKKELIEKATYKDDQDNIVQSYKDTYILSEDGRTLRILEERTFDGSIHQMQDIFDKE
jgi:hypothetical protein